MLILVQKSLLRSSFLLEHGSYAKEKREINFISSVEEMLELRKILTMERKNWLFLAKANTLAKKHFTMIQAKIEDMLTL